MQPWRRLLLDVLIGLALPAAASLTLSSQSGQTAWWHAPAVVRNQLAGELLALDAFLLVLAAAVANPPRRMAQVAAGSLVSSALIVATLAGRGPLRPWFEAHVVLAAAVAATLTIRAIAGRVIRHPLDASGLVAVMVLLACTGVLAVGPAVPMLPAWSVDGLLRINPVIAVTSAAGIDPLRTEPLYTLSPVAHWAFVYPRISASLALYACIAAACSVGILRASHTRTPR